MKVIAFLFGRILDRSECYSRQISEELICIKECIAPGSTDTPSFKSYEEILAEGFQSEEEFIEQWDGAVWQDNWMMESLRDGYVTAILEAPQDETVVLGEDDLTNETIAGLLLSSIWRKVNMLREIRDDCNNLALQLLMNPRAMRTIFRRRGRTDYSMPTEAADSKVEMEDEFFSQSIFHLVNKAALRISQDDTNLLRSLGLRAENTEERLRDLLRVRSLEAGRAGIH